MVNVSMNSILNKINQLEKIGQTEHRVLTCNSNNLSEVDDKSVALIVTSPPYPMISMWDSIFSEQSNTVKTALTAGDGAFAFEFMHKVLAEVWHECDRVLMDSGIICINIGDATRTIGDRFQIYSNHSKIIEIFSEMGYSVLPDIIWHKQSNSPNKFLGSGMYPTGAYVTYEHKYILIFRKGGNRKFDGEAEELRKKSAYFWEERNKWFSDIWNIKGKSQKIDIPSRDRSAAFPFEIPYRLINMYSIQGDTVLDPFLGIGTTSLACMTSNRNSIGVELDAELSDMAMQTMCCEPHILNKVIDNRYIRHTDFIRKLPTVKYESCYYNKNLKTKVKTMQETDIEFYRILDVRRTDSDRIVCDYGEWRQWM